MTDAREDEKVALEQVIRSFSDAEVALQEIAAESQRIRSATLQLGAAQAALEGSSAAVGELATAVAGAAERLQESAGALKAAAQRLSELDPARVHAQLTALHADVEASTASTRTTVSKLADEAHIDRTQFAKEQNKRADTIDGSLEILTGRLTRQTQLTAAVLVVALVAAAASLYAAFVA